MDEVIVTNKKDIVDKLIDLFIEKRGDEIYNKNISAFLNGYYDDKDFQNIAIKNLTSNNSLVFESLIRILAYMIDAQSLYKYKKILGAEAYLILSAKLGIKNIIISAQDVYDWENGYNENNLSYLLHKDDDFELISFFAISFDKIILEGNPSEWIFYNKYFTVKTDELEITSSYNDNKLDLEWIEAHEIFLPNDISIYDMYFSCDKLTFIQGKYEAIISEGYDFLGIYGFNILDLSKLKETDLYIPNKLYEQHPPMSLGLTKIIKRKDQKIKIAKKYIDQLKPLIVNI